MNDTMNPLALARQPKQSRAIDRFEAVLEATEAILAESGLEGFSIPAVAERLGYTRASIYKFFPTPYAILNELVRRHFDRLQDALRDEAGRWADESWQAQTARMVKLAAKVHNAHPVGMMLSLGGATTDEANRIYASTIQQLGLLIEAVLQRRGHALAASALDVPTLAVDLATTCLRQSLQRHGRITPAYVDVATSTIVDFLERHIVAVPAMRAVRRS
ncbi:MAG TPA: TetR/AcrR family transcriptional regulator [Fontimonas sp.]